MKKKRVLSIVLSVMLVSAMFAFTGCGNGSGSGANGELNIFTWTEYVPEAVMPWELPLHLEQGQ